jgi:hypothetical protein
MELQRATAIADFLEKHRTADAKTADVRNPKNDKSKLTIDPFGSRRFITLREQTSFSPTKKNKIAISELTKHPCF